MPDLQLTVEGAEVVQFAAAPLLAFKVRIVNTSVDEIVHTVALRAQIQIEVSRRKYDSNEQARLLDLFGEPDRWGQTLRSLLWTHASVVVPGFTGSVLADIPVACTFDFNVAATKYFHGVTHGELPLVFPVQRDRLLYGRRRNTPGGPYLVGQRVEVSTAGEGLERPDGRTLPKLGLAIVAPGYV